MPFVAMPKHEGTNAIFILGQLQENFLAEKTNMYFVFVDLEKAFG